MLLKKELEMSKTQLSLNHKFNKGTKKLNVILEAQRTSKDPISLSFDVESGATTELKGKS